MQLAEQNSGSAWVGFVFLRVALVPYETPGEMFAAMVDMAVDARVLPTSHVFTTSLATSLAVSSLPCISPAKDLITRLYNLLGQRWALIVGRIPGRSAEEIKKYCCRRYGSD
ncbi:hypothetical protein SUGI_0210200 [Cryptomeria japonica]|nr:hypothetical protein SUGI_0210200 [Cryptomeria japonica]